MAISVRIVDAAMVRGFLHNRAEVPFQQRPSYAQVKDEWGHLYLGWFAEGEMVGSALVLLRPLPKLPWALAYLPEGPILDWDLTTPTTALKPMLEVLKAQGCFMVKIGPRLPVHRWRAATIRSAMGAGTATRWRDVPADETTSSTLLAESLAAAGWLPYEAPGVGFGGTLQPRYGFELDLADRSLDDIRAGMSTQWRRNVNRAQKRGVVVERMGVEGIGEFHRLLRASGDRGGFEPRDEEFFRRMFTAILDEDPDAAAIYLASHDGTAHAGMLMVSSGDRDSYTFGGSDDEGRDVRPSNAVQWQMVQDSHARGARVFDLRGVSDALGADDPNLGLTTFKAGLGADAVEYLGEWDYPLRPAIARAFRAYWNRKPH